MTAGYNTDTVQLPTLPPPIAQHRRRRHLLTFVVVMAVVAAVGAALGVWLPHRGLSPLAALTGTVTHPSPVSPTPTPTPPFDPNVGAILPAHRIVAFYAVPGAAVTGPAYLLSASMLARLRTQGAAYDVLDPAHPVKLGIDLVVSVPDRYKGKSGTYSHHVSDSVIDSYVRFCRRYDLLLFLDLNIGWANPVKELMSFSKYLRLPFVEVAVDPEWMFPRHNGIPGVNLSNVRASDLNPMIDAVAAMPMEYHVPRKVMIIHQYRGDGDGTAHPYDPGSAEIADKRNIVNDPRVDLVIHIDSVGGWPGDIGVKEAQYHKWVALDMARYRNFRYGGFKIFYILESRHRLMTPAEVMSMKPKPMVITYGN